MLRNLHKRLLFFNYLIFFCAVAAIVAVLIFRAPVDGHNDDVLWRVLGQGHVEGAEDCVFLRQDADGLSQSGSGYFSPEELERMTEPLGELEQRGGRKFRYLRVEEEGTVLFALRPLPGIRQYLRYLGPLVLSFLLLIFLAAYVTANRAMVPIQLSWLRQKRFTEGASEQLESPVQSLQANLDQVLAQPESTVADMQKWLDNMLSDLRRMKRLTDRLLALSRGEMADRAAEELDVSAVVETAAGLWEDTIWAAGLDYQRDIQPNLRALADKEDMEQLISLLLDNAVKYNPAPGSVTLVLREHRGKLRLMVEDTGVGMDAQQLPRIFDRFYRADAMRTSGERGHGLGLSIAMQIVQTMRGNIHVRSAPGEGSCFTVTLPILLKQER